MPDRARGLLSPPEPLRALWFQWRLRAEEQRVPSGQGEENMTSTAPSAPTAPIAPSAPIRVLIAENHADLSDTLAQIIDSEPDMRCVGQVASAAAVLAAVRGSGANVLVLDLGLQGGSGMELIEGLAASEPALRIVVFSGLCNDLLTREILQRGAAAFVAKGSDPSVLLEELRRSGRADDRAA